MNATFSDIVAHNIRALEHATIYPFVVRAYAEKADGTCELFAAIVQRPMHDAPLGEDVIPEGARLRWASVYPAAHFDEMRASQRASHRSDYREFLMWRKARSLEKDVAQLVPWVDYDAVMVDAQVQRWVTGSAS